MLIIIIINNVLITKILKLYSSTTSEIVLGEKMKKMKLI